MVEEEQRVEELKLRLLEVIDFPPRVKKEYQIQREIGGGYTDAHYQNASKQLQMEKKIVCVNGWWSKRRFSDDRQLSEEDIQWLLGTRRYGQ